LITSNENIGPEESESFTMSIEQDFGVLMDALEGLTVRFDYYDITVNNAIVGIGTQSVLWNDYIGGSELTNNVTFYNADGIGGDGSASGAPVGTGTTSGSTALGGVTCPAGATYVKREGSNSDVYIIRSCANGRVDYIGASSTNVGEINVVGHDLFVNYMRDVGPGVMNIALDYTSMDEYNSDAFTGSTKQVNSIGFPGTPETRNNLSLSYSWDRYSVALTRRHIGDYRLNSVPEIVGGSATGGIVASGDTQDEYDALDLQINADLGKYGTVTYGIFNVEDTDPLPDRVQNYETYLSLYGNQGMISYLKWNVKF